MSARGEELVRVRVWDLVVRSTHWLIVLSIVVLAVTGFQIGHPVLRVSGEARYHFLQGTVRVVHFYAAIVFTLAVLSRLLWMFVGGRQHARWRELVPVTAARRAGIWAMLKFYLFARRRPIPVVGHNPLAGVVYLAVFGLHLVMIATGFAMYSIDAPRSPIAWAGQAFLPLFGGAESARWIHHVVMWLIIGFAVHHVYSALLTSAVERNGTMESIFSGTKWVERDLVDEDVLEQEKRGGR